jgi:hypothetical protein
MDFLTYALSLNPSVLTVPIMGHLNTYDGYGRSVTLVGSPSWRNPTDQGFGIYPESNGAYSVADGAEQDFTDQTIFVYSPEGFLANSITGTPAWQDVITKRSGAGFAYIFRLYTDATTKYIYIYNSAVASKSYAYNVDGKTSLAIKTVGSSSVTFYADGSSINSTSGLDFSSQPDVPITFGNVYTGVSPMLTSLSIGAIFPAGLTDTQIGLLHQYATQIQYGYKPKVRSFIPREDNKGAVIDLWGSPNSSGVITDNSGNGNDGTIGGRLSVINDAGTTIYEADGEGASKITVSPSSSINDKYEYTMLIDFDQKSSGESGGGRILDRTRIQIYPGFFVTNQSDGNAVWTVTVPQGRGLLAIKQNRNDPTILPQIQFNGVDLSVAVFTAKTGTAVSDAGNNLILLNRGSGDRAADAKLGSFRFYPSQLSDANLRDEYVKYTTSRVIQYTPRFQYPTSLASVTPYNYAGPWIARSGSMKWSDDGTSRFLETDTVATHIANLPGHHVAYGAFYFEHTPSSANSWIGIIQDIPGDYSTSGQSSYSIRFTSGDQVIRFYVDAVAVLNTGQTFTYGQTYKMFIIRQSTDGKFTLYIKGGSEYSTWTNIGTVTDNTHTTSNYFSANMYSSGADIRNVFAWPGGDTLSPNDIPYIAD